MNPEASGAEAGESVETESQQTQEQPKSFAQQLQEAAEQMGVVPKEDKKEEPVQAISSEPEPEVEETPEVEIEGGEATGDNDVVQKVEDEDEEREEAVPPAEGEDATEYDDRDKNVRGLRKDIAKLRERKNKLSDEVEQKSKTIAQLEAELAEARTPRPTVKDPFADVMSLSQLKKVEGELRQFIIEADRVPADADEVPVGDGKIIPRAEFDAIVKDANRNLDWFLPERKAYLAAREQAEAEATVPYPELKGDSAFTKEVDKIVGMVLSGEAAKRPDLRLMAARMVRGWQYEMAVAQQQTSGTVAQKNGNGKADAEKIVKAAKQKVAPTPVKARSLTERRSESANLEKTKKAFEQSQSAEDALAYYEAKQRAAAANSRSLAPIRG